MAEETKSGSLLSMVVKGKVEKPHLLIIHGPDGVGKTTFAADSPSPIFLGPEDGSNNLDVSRFPSIKSIETVFQAVTELISSQHQFKTLAVDSLDWIENLIHASVCAEKKVSSIEEIPYGKGYVFAFEKWKELIQHFNLLREKRNMNMIFIAHSKIKKFEDPSTPAGYERYQLKLHQGANTDAAALWREYVDSVLFANYVTFTSDSDKKRGFGDGTRMIYTQRRPGFDAKNRNGLPFELPLSWNDYEEAVKKGEPNSLSSLIQDINSLKEQVKQKDLIEKIDTAIKSAGGDVTKLSKIKNRIEALIGKEG